MNTDGWFFATANWNEQEDIRVLPVHPDDLSGGLVIPQYELVTVENGHIRPLYTNPNYVGTVLSLAFEPPRRLAGFVIDAPYDEGALKRERKLCIIRHGRVVLPALIEPPNRDWRALGQSHIPFTLNRFLVRGERRLMALVRPDWVLTQEEDYYTSRAGMCRDVKIRLHFIGGHYRWIHQAKCYFEPRFLLGWGWT